MVIMKKNYELGEIPYEKSNNVEINLFRRQGRITRKSFFFRAVLCAAFWLVVHLAYTFWETPNYNSWVERGGGKIQEGAAQIENRHNVARCMDYYIIPGILLLFVIIQAAKRAHDCNRSAWCLLVPFYNIYLLFANGTPDDNNYGLLPHREKKSPSYKKEE